MLQFPSDFPTEEAKVVISALRGSQHFDLYELARCGWVLEGFALDQALQKEDVPSEPEEPAEPTEGSEGDGGLASAQARARAQVAGKNQGGTQGAHPLSHEEAADHLERFCAAAESGRVQGSAATAGFDWQSLVVTVIPMILDFIRNRRKPTV